MLACVKIQIHKNQASSVFIFELAKIIVLLWFCLSASHDIESFSVPPGWSIPLTSLFVDGTTAHTENPKGLAIFFL